MNITWENLNIGEWVDVSKPYHKKSKQKFLELRLKEINKCVGKIYINEHACHVKALLSTESDGVHMSFNQVLTENELKEFWKSNMTLYLQKIFK